MARTIDATLAAHIATGKTTLARCLRLDLVDGTSIGITDHDADLSINLGDGAITYKASTGIIPSAISLSVGLDADNFEAKGPLTALVTPAAVLGGRFDRARARLFDVNWASLTHFARLMSGKVSQARIEAGEFVVEVRSVADAFNQSIGRVLSPICSNDYGDAKCQASVPSFPATVATVTDDMSFTVTYTGATPGAGVLKFGKCVFLTGPLAGTRPMEIFGETSGSVDLYQPLVEKPVVGDTMTLYGGCSKLRASDDVTLVTCLSNNNVVNFGGFPDGPGSAQYLKYPIPGTTA